MKHTVNISRHGQVFPYLIEYANTEEFISKTDSNDKPIIKWNRDSLNSSIKVFKNDIHHYKHGNDWYNISNIADTDWSYEHIPDIIKTIDLRVYIPNHTPNTYVRSIKYAINVNTWIDNYKIDLGTYIFDQSDALANPNGVLKNGNFEYHEYVEFKLIDPFQLIYSDEWNDFRQKVCLEKPDTNYNGTTLYVSLYVINEYEDGYILEKDCNGGYTNFSMSNDNDYLKLNLSVSNNPLGFKFDIQMNSVYNSLMQYLYETYNIKNISTNQIVFDIVIKNKDSVIFDPTTARLFNAEETYGKATQYICIKNISTTLIKEYFDSWSSFEEGWSLVGSLTVYNKQYFKAGEEALVADDDVYELISFVSNEIPITQEIFSMFTNGGSEEIIKLSDMNIKTFNVINKIENNIIQVERPNESKANIVQPVFFRVKDAEVLTLHPVVTENISINLDDYKSKVNRFILKIGDNMFDQIGANSYGILFKIKANVLPPTLTAGTYYILDENKELVTTGKYNCVV